MNAEKILKKLQKKQRMLLKILLSRDINTADDKDARLNNIALKLRLDGIVDPHRLSLTPDGREFVSQHKDAIFADLHLDEKQLFDKLLLVRYNTKELKTIKKVDRLFLIFLADGPVDKIHIRRYKQFVPTLQSLGFITGDDTISLTALGKDMLQESEITESEKLDARSRFYTNSRSNRIAETESKAEIFISLYRHGSSYDEIGKLHNITRERVRQILNCTPKYAELLAEHKQAKLEIKRRQKLSADKDSRITKLEKSLANQFPEQVDALWDHEKNIGLEPTEIAAHSAMVEIWWKCPRDGHSWKKKPADIVTSWSRSKTFGCPKCAGKTAKPTKQPTLAEAFPEFVRKYWDFDKNRLAGIDPDVVTLASNYSAWLKCPDDGNEWQPRIHSMVRQQWKRGNSGCRVCNGTIHRKIGEWNKAEVLSKEYPQQIATLWHTELNLAVGLMPDDLTFGSAKEAWFKCPIDGFVWQAKISAIRRAWDNDRSGCPACFRPSLLLNSDQTT